MEALWTSSTTMQGLLKKRKLEPIIDDKEAKRCRLQLSSFGFLKPLSPTDSDTSGSTVVTFTDISGSQRSSGVALSGSGSTYKENLIRQEGTSSLADKTPSSHERPQSKVEAASQGLQLAEHSAASMPNGECPRCYLGLCTVPCNQGPCKMRIEAERLCGDLSTVTANSRQGAAAHQHRLPALSSLGIAQRNAAKFTDGEAPDNFRPRALPNVNFHLLPTNRANNCAGYSQQAWVPTARQPDPCCRGVLGAAPTACQGFPPLKAAPSQCRLSVPGQCSRQQQGLPEAGLYGPVQCSFPLRASYYAGNSTCTQPTWNTQRPQVMPLIRMAPKTRQQYVQQVGAVLNLHKDTVRFTEHLFARLKGCQVSPPWRSHLLFMGCLWIACKLEESREGLPTAQQLVNLVRPPAGSGVIVAGAVNAVEIQVMKMLGWQPLQGWDDLNHCKGIRMS